MHACSRGTLGLAVSLLLVAAGALAPVMQAEAARPGTRASASGNVNRPVQAQRGHAEAGARSTAQGGGRAASANANRNTSTNRNTSVSRSSNVNIDSSREVHIDVDDGCCHGDHWDDHPVATAAAVTGAVALTSAVIGSIVNTVPPGCVPVMVNGMTYQQCGSTWYQPQYAGTAVQYVVVPAP
ncbi:hypothetical protein [Pseudoxanthomonas koreensis]|uniref:hypothetical protein n=1 Tax=Pseudoxanthomonas koreensis TaxID=266061 RepID=UPI001390FEFD|nr:hypothetical protein [Pseudoxanthomonas koreensis]KAF1692470.1 hypothetical protein CSC64_06975 [Pseudoxanthomonas koreensis]